MHHSSGMSILIAGDFHLQYRALSLIESGECNFVFSKVTDILRKADYSIVNLESPVVLDIASPIKKTGPNLKSSYIAVETLKKIGFNCVTLANNHFYDFGEIGVNDTISCCKKYEIDYVGGGHNLFEAEKILYKEIDGKKLAIINICENEWSIATEQTGGAAPLNPISNYYKILEAKNKADYVIVIVHGGTEHYNLPTPRMKQTYRFFIDAGADVVVNHHQHCYSGYEKYNQGFIFYGLGNFCFDKGFQKSTFWNKGFVLKLKIDDNIAFELLPYIQCTEKPTIDFNIDNDSFNNEIITLNEIIKDDKRLLKEYDQLVVSKEKSYITFIQPYKNKYLSFLYSSHLIPSLLTKQWYKLLFALIRCESHRDILRNVLRNKI